MNPRSPTPPPTRSTSKRPILLLLGVALILLGIFVPRPVFEAAQGMEPGTFRSIAFISTDVFRLCFFVGLICVIIGLLRLRKS